MPPAIRVFRGPTYGGDSSHVLLSFSLLLRMTCASTCSWTSNGINIQVYHEAKTRTNNQNSSTDTQKAMVSNYEPHQQVPTNHTIVQRDYLTTCSDLACQEAVYKLHR